MILGPPTTLSPSGVDHSLYLQGALTRDTTRFLWGFPLGARDAFTVLAPLGLVLNTLSTGLDHAADLCLAA